MSSKQTAGGETEITEKVGGWILLLLSLKQRTKERAT
jgi:hypothetical protein